MYKEKKDKFFWFLIFLPIFLLATWFKDGLVLAGAEESFSIFHKINAIDKNSVWQESGLGFAQPVYSANIPITLFNQLNLNFGFSIFFVQMFFFYILIVTGTVSVYFLVKQLFCNFKDVNILAFCSSLFYLFNLYGLTQIWSRFLYSQMGIWAFLPLLTLLAIKYFRTNNVLYLFIIFISQVFFSFVYTIVVNVLLVIFVLFFIFFIDIFSTKKITKVKIFKALLVCATLIISNIWWISYNFLYIRGSFDNRIDHLTNFESLKSVSAYFPLQEILLLRQRFLLNQNFIWNFFYDSAFSYLLSVAILILFLVGLVNYWFKPVVRYLFYFFVIVLFFAKGANPPLGLEVYKFLFFSFPETAIFRNSYEKLGVLLLLPYSVFVSLGLLHLRNLGRYRFVLGIILIFALSYPMINGDVMRNFRVKIPYEYESLNSKVNAFTGCKNEGSRILVLPMTNGDGAVYKWGYTGVIPTEYFVDCTLISRYVGNKFSDLEYQKLYQQLVSHIYDENQFKKMNIKYVLFQKDLAKGGHLDELWLNDWMIFNLKEIMPLKLIFEDSIFEFYEVEFGNNQTQIVDIEGIDLISISVNKISPTHYLGKLNFEAKFARLIFKSSYHPYWKLKIGNREYKSHEYGGLNSWVLENISHDLIEIKFAR